nr:hypothetical protein [Burkholderia sp. LA-2-3-30-S1-D2]
MPRFCPSRADGERIALGRRVVAPSTDAERNVHAPAERRIDARLGSRVDLLAQRGFCANYVSDVLGADRTATPAALLRTGTLSLEFDGIVFDPARRTRLTNDGHARGYRITTTKHKKAATGWLEGRAWRRHRRREARSLFPPDRRPVRRIFTGASEHNEWLCNSLKKFIFHNFPD